MKRRAFTLVELLVVIGIIAVLIGVLLPALGKARAQANLTACMSNLRTIGQTIAMYTTAHKGVLPYGYWDGTPPGNSGFDSNRSADWSLLLLNFLSNKFDTNYTGHAQTGGEWARLRDVFHDTDTQPGTGILHYSAHPRLMPNIDDLDISVVPLPSPSTGPWLQPYRISRIRRSSEVVLMMDGAQTQGVGGSNGWGAYATAYKLDQQTLYAISRGLFIIDHPNARLNEPVNGGPNKDARFQSDPGAGDIRWRHQKNTRANFLFVDGHVESRLYKSPTSVELKKSNFFVNK